MHKRNKMEIVILQVSKTTENCLQKLVEEYAKRIGSFVPLKIETINTKLSTENENLIKETESKLIYEKIKNLKSNFVILLDEKGEELTTLEFASKLEEWQNKYKKIIFVIGGAYGFSEELKKNYFRLSLSKMTFQHQIVRLIFIEQLYRALTIIKGLKYHH